MRVRVRDDVRGSGRDQKQIGVISELNMTGTPIFFFVEETSRHRILRKRLYQALTEVMNSWFRSRRSTKNIVMLFTEQTASSPIWTRDRSRHAEDDRFLIPGFGFWIGSYR